MQQSFRAKNGKVIFIQCDTRSVAEFNLDIKTKEWKELRVYCYTTDRGKRVD